MKAQLDGAQWNLDKTTVRAPGDGYVTTVALRKGSRVANLPLMPVMAFIDTADTIIGVEIAQNDARYVKPGQVVERSNSCRERFTGGKVQSVLQAIAIGQVQTSESAAMPQAIEAMPFLARVILDDARFARTLPAGSTGAAAIFTDRLKATHVVRRVVLRQTAILNHVNPFSSRPAARQRNSHICRVKYNYRPQTSISA